MSKVTLKQKRYTNVKKVTDEINHKVIVSTSQGAEKLPSLLICTSAGNACHRTDIRHKSREIL